MLIALGLGGVSVAQAQDMASSWYLAPRIGVDVPDSDRTTKTTLYSGIGLGAWVNPNFSVDLEYGINNAEFKDSSPRANHQWESVQLDIAGRYYFGDVSNTLRPYVMGAVGALRHKAYSGFLLQNQSFSGGGGWDPMAAVGVGVSYNLSDRLSVRGEVAARYDRDNNSINSTVSDNYFPYRKSGFTDGIATIGLTYNFGGHAAAAAPAPSASTPPPPAPPPVREAPATTSTTIDLRGVEFKFDHPRVGEKIVPSLKAPTAESVQILDEAVDTLKRNPNVRVEVDGHTDSVGSDAYNQKLSERRAKGVYDYLAEHGVSSSQLDGPKGFGESAPIDTNDTAAGRQRNRRTELKVEN
ncbi:MAG: OmpA family protein [Rudaea sp.]